MPRSHIYAGRINTGCSRKTKRAILVRGKEKKQRKEKEKHPSAKHPKTMDSDTKLTMCNKMPVTVINGHPKNE